MKEKLICMYCHKEFIGEVDPFVIQNTSFVILCPEHLHTTTFNKDGKLVLRTKKGEHEELAKDEPKARK